jgi:hypothetical protein
MMYTSILKKSVHVLRATVNGTINVIVSRKRITDILCVKCVKTAFINSVNL